MLVRFTNTLLLALVGLLTLTGVYGLVWPFPGWMYDVHRWAGWSLIALIPWKTLISFRSLKRGLQPRFDRSVMIVVSMALAAGTLFVLVLGVMWAWRLGPELLWLGAYGDTAISWHWMIALGLLPFFVGHAWRRWPRPRRADFLSRRSALKLAALGAAGVAGWGLAEYLARTNASAPRRFTGSREQDSFTGNQFPVTNSVGEGQVRVPADDWRLTLGGAVGKPLTLTYADLLALPNAEKAATIDCTTGWYSTQKWRGLPLPDLLALAQMDSAASAVRLRGISGYAMDFTLAEAQEILLATHVGGEVLDHWHGFPLRAVVPSRRGWLWVKWVIEVEVLVRPHT